MLKRLVNRQTPLIGALLTRAFGPRTLGLRYLELLSPYAAVGMSKLRVGNPTGDGGYVMVDSFHGVSAALSWHRRQRVMGFRCREPRTKSFNNHTLTAPHLYRSFTSGYRSREKHAKTEISQFDNNGFRNPRCSDLILKMDVEGAEWSALSSNSRISSSGFHRWLLRFTGLFGNQPCRAAQAANPPKAE
jgi:hypothetical protein